MDATPSQVPPNPDLGASTVILIEQGTRAQKLLRLRWIKAQLRELRPEHDRLEAELFGQAL